MPEAWRCGGARFDGDAVTMAARETDALRQVATHACDVHGLPDEQLTDPPRREHGRHRTHGAARRSSVAAFRPPCHAGHPAGAGSRLLPVDAFRRFITAPAWRPASRDRVLPRDHPSAGRPP